MFPIPKGYEKYCKRSIFCEVGDKEIVDFALQLIGKEKEPKKVVNHLFLWVRDNIGWDLNHIIGAKNLLRTKRRTAVCLDHVNLFNALCRSIGIPARYVFIMAEFDFKTNKIPKKIGHVVSEVFLEGEWLIVDPTFGKMDSKILKLHKLEEPSWNKMRVLWRVKNLPLPIYFLTNLLVYTYPNFHDMVKNYYRRK